MSDQKKILEHLIQLTLPIGELISLLETLGWDSDEVAVLLKRIDIIAVLTRYLRSEITEADVEVWANAIEGREDIEYEAGYEDIIKSTIFELANPLLTKSLTHQTATDLLVRLNRLAY